MASIVRPIQWEPRRLQAFLDWIDEELTHARGARQGLERKWRQYLELYRAPADQPKARFPFEGAANFMLPVIATDTDQLYASFMQTIHAPENLWTTQPLNESWVGAAKPMQDFLQLLDHRLLKMYAVNKRAMLEMVKLGTAIYKTHWHYEDRLISSFASDGPRTVRRVRSIPVVDHVRLADFLLPPHALDINPEAQAGAEWVAERLRLHPSRLLALATASEPLLPNFGKAAVERIVQFYESTQTEYASKVRELDYDKRARIAVDWEKSTDGESARGGGGVRTREVELWEIRARVQTAGDRWDDIVVWYHQPTRTLLRDIYDDSPFGRPYDVIRYFPSDGFFGIGVAEQMEMFQRSMSDVFNFMHQNMLLGNSIGIAARAGANIGPGEPIYPGMVKLTDGNPKDEFMPFKLGDINPGIVQTFSLLQSLANRRDGVSDLQLGQIDTLPSRTPATSVLSLLQEGKRRPDLTIKDLRYEGLSAVGLKVLQLLQYHIGQRTDQASGSYLRLAVESLGMPEGAEVAKKLAMPLEDVQLGLAVQLTATSGSQNKDVAQQKYATLMQLATQTAQAVMQFQATALQMPALAPVATTATNALKELFTRLLEQYDIPNVDQIVPPAPAQAPDPALLGLGGAPAGMQPGTGGPDAGAGGPPPVDGVPAGAGSPV